MAFAAWGARADRGRHRRRAARGAERLAAAHKDWARLADVYAERMDATFDAPAAHAGDAAGIALRERALGSEPRGRLPAQGAVAAWRRGAGAGRAGADPRQARRARRARAGAGARGRAGQRAERAGRLPVGAGDVAPRAARAIPRGRSPPFATPSSATPRTRRPIRRWSRCSIARRPRRGLSTSSNRWRRRVATTRSWSRSTAGGSSCATIGTSARTGCAGSPTWPPISWVSPRSHSRLSPGR